jgi:hypothetical protein
MGFDFDGYNIDLDLLDNVTEITDNIYCVVRQNSNLETEPMRSVRAFRISFRLSAPAVLLALSGTISTSAATEIVGKCRFDPSASAFNGSPQEQAKCLMRDVAKFGRVSAAPAVIPGALADLIGTPTGTLKTSLTAYLAKNKLDAAQLGGSLDSPLSHSMDGKASAPTARYFVIHDTSSPWLADATGFPPNNAPELNELSGYLGPDSVAHVFVNRLGETVTGHDFQVPWRATKLETQVIGTPSKGLFLHTELLQPRRREPTGGPKNDAIAPMPGFTAEQYDKLSLLFAMASARAGTWLIPAYHAALDDGIPDGHDDPQNFDINAFVSALVNLRSSLSTVAGGPPSAAHLAPPVGAPVATAAAVAATPAAAGTRDLAALCRRLDAAAPHLSGGSPLLAGSTGKTYQQFYQTCDSDNVFAGQSLPVHGSERLKCSSDPNKVEHITRYPDGTIVFRAKMAVDADGSPVIGGSGWPNNVQTWLVFDSGSTSDFVNAEEVPFVVVPGAVPGTDISFLSDTGIGKGDLAVAFKDGKCSFGVVGDAGPFFRLGEASLRSHDDLGNPQCATAGQHPCKRLRGGSGVGIGSGVNYIIFPKTRPIPLQSQTVNALAAEQVAAKADAFLTAQGH